MKKIIKKTATKKRQCIRRTLQIIVNDLPDSELQHIAHFINSSRESSLLKARKGLQAAKVQSVLWTSPFENLSDEILLRILPYSFNSSREALQIACVCWSWYRLFSNEIAFWEPLIERLTSDCRGFNHLFNSIGPHAAVSAKLRTSVEGRQGWCHKNIEEHSTIMGYCDKNQCFNGNAVIINHEKSEVYTGEVLNSCPHGFGTLELSSSELTYCYKGHWLHGKRHGSGEEVYADRERIIGSWQHDQLHGAFTHFWMLGGNRMDRLEGTAVNGQLHGNCIYYYANGNVQYIHYENDRAHGHSEVHTVTGNTISMFYEDNTVVSDLSVVYHNGDLFKGRLVNGVPKGFYYKLQPSTVSIPLFFNETPIPLLQQQHAASCWQQLLCCFYRFSS